MRARTTTVTAGLLLLPLALAACAPTETSAAPAAPTAGDSASLTVGVAMPSTAITRWIADGENVKAQLEDLGHEVDLRNAEDDAALQAEQIGEMIEGGADALVVGAVDGTVLTGVLSEAKAAGIPVLSYDRLILGSDAIEYYATFDNARVGVQQATSLLEGIGVLDAQGAPTGAKGPFALELFAGSPDDNNATVFYQGAMSVLQPYLDSGVLTVPSGETDLATIGTPGWDGDTAGQRMTALLAEGVPLDAVLAPNDGLARGILASLGNAGYGTDAKPWPVVTGQDAEVDSVRLVAEGTQHSTIYKDTRQLAEVAVSMLDAMLNGEEPETNDLTSYDNGVKVVPSYLLAPQVVTAENYEAVLIDSGYYAQEDLR